MLQSAAIAAVVVVVEMRARGEELDGVEPVRAISSQMRRGRAASRGRGAWRPRSAYARQGLSACGQPLDCTTAAGRRARLARAT